MNPQGWENQFRLRIRFPILLSVLLNRSVLQTINIAGLGRCRWFQAFTSTRTSSWTTSRSTASTTTTRCRTTPTTCSASSTILPKCTWSMRFASSLFLGCHRIICMDDRMLRLWFLQLKYPESCLRYEYDRTFPIRGLYYDRLKGCLLKLDFFGSIEPDGCFFGRQRVICSLLYCFSFLSQPFCIQLK